MSESASTANGHDKDRPLAKLIEKEDEISGETSGSEDEEGSQAKSGSGSGRSKASSGGRSSSTRSRSSSKASSKSSASKSDDEAENSDDEDGAEASTSGTSSGTKNGSKASEEETTASSDGNGNKASSEDDSTSADTKKSAKPDGDGDKGSSDDQDASGNVSEEDDGLSLSDLREELSELTALASKLGRSFKDYAVEEAGGKFKHAVSKAEDHLPSLSSGGVPSPTDLVDDIADAVSGKVRDGVKSALSSNGRTILTFAALSYVAYKLGSRKS